MRADHEDPLLSAEHAELAIEPHEAAGGGRLELGPQRRHDGDELEGDEHDGERAKTHRPRPMMVSEEAIPVWMER
jgi:hypothetical protein